MRFNNLLHHVSVDGLEQAYRSLHRQAATGVDGLTWEGYGANLQENLQELHRRIQTGSYHPKPSRRIWIPKADGGQRPIGVAALEDKIVQQALVWVLESIFDEDFLGFSYGFRPGRGQHQALDAFRSELCRQWRKALRRRGNKRPINWSTLTRLIRRWVPSVRIVHPYPNQRWNV